MLTKLYSQLSLKNVPQLIIIFLIFMILFCFTSITINAANKLSYTLLVMILIINQFGCYFIFNHQNQGTQIYTILISILITFSLLYVLYIKRIYTKEAEIIKDLKDKDIIEDTNIAC
jgi:Ca2+/Na+ antiporter